MELNRAKLLEEVTPEQLNSIVRAVNSYDGNLQEYEAYDTEDIEDILHGMPLRDVLGSLSEDFNIYDDMFRIDTLGHIVSFDKYTYYEELEDNIEEIIDVFIENYSKYDVNFDIDEYILLDEQGVIDALGVEDNMEDETYIQLVERIHDLGIHDVMFVEDARHLIGVDVDDYEEMDITVNDRTFSILYKEGN